MRLWQTNFVGLKCERCCWKSGESNQAARAFYTSLGFVEEGRRPSYYADPVEDAILMRLQLPVILN